MRYNSIFFNFNKRTWQLAVMAAIAFAPTELKATEWAGQSDTGHGMLLFPSDGATVKGIVVDTEGNPLVGASVLIKGSTNGTVTNADGRFSLNTPSRGATLVVSYMGFKTAEVQARSEMRIELQEEVYMQGEIVVTALGIKKEERSLAYHVQQVTGENLMKVQDANFVNSLNGKIAGVQINANASGIGGSSRVVMRGTKSIDGSNNVLYVIDGIPMLNVQNGLDENAGMYSGNGQTGDATAMLNPDDIETISALTGPSAAALYGSAAANGVILITTKKGKEGVTNVTYNASMQFSSPLRLPEFQKKYGQTEPGSYYSWGDVLSTESSYDPADFFRTGTNFSQSVSLSTGNKKNLTYLSAGSVTAGGIVHNNDYDRYNLSVRNTTSLLHDKMTLDLSYMLSNVKEQNMIAQGQYFNPLVPVYLFPAGADWDAVQYFERYDADRNFPVQYWPYGRMDMSMQNPYWITERNRFVNHKTRHMITASLKWDINDWISLTGRVKYDDSNEKAETKLSAGTDLQFASKFGHYGLTNRKYRQLFAESFATINHDFSDHQWNLTAIAGANYEQDDYEMNGFDGNLASVPNIFTVSNVDTYNSKTKYSQEGYTTKKEAVFASAQLGYKHAAYLDLTARNDWSSKLAGAEESYFYWSAGFSGILTDLIPAIFHLNGLDFLRARVSYSEVGNDPAVPFITQPTYPITNSGVTTTTTMFNPDLKAERTKSVEAGIDLQMLHGKLKVNATLYHSRTYNQFFNIQLPASSGYTNVIVNAGRVDNKGVELNAQFAQPLGAVQWNTYLTWTLNRNVIKKMLHDWRNPQDGQLYDLTELDRGGMLGYKTRLVEGGSLSDIYVNTLKVDEHGMIYLDVSRSNRPEATDNIWVRAGNAAPKYQLAWGNEFAWKGFKAGVLLSLRAGGIVVSQTQAIMDAFGASKASADARDQGGVTVNGRPIDARQYYEVVASTGHVIGSQYVYSATNLRLAELTLGYSVPIHRLLPVFKSMDVSFVAHNLCLLYCKAPFDPEQTANTGTYFQGVDYFMQPSLRTLGFSVKFVF